MQIFLVWTPIQLYMAVVAVLIGTLLALVHFKRHTIHVALVALVVSAIVAISAFNDTPKPENQPRYSFNVEAPARH